jgi:hypothetical protein
MLLKTQKLSIELCGSNCICLRGNRCEDGVIVLVQTSQQIGDEFIVKRISRCRKIICKLRHLCIIITCGSKGYPCVDEACVCLGRVEVGERTPGMHRSSAP